MIEPVSVAEPSMQQPTNTAASPIDEAQRKLSAIAEETGHPLDDLLDWYKDDLEDFAAIPMDEVRHIVDDYLKHIAFYRRYPVLAQEVMRG